MTTITTLQGTDSIKDSRTPINENFANLNTDKIDVDGSVAMEADLAMGSNKITGLAYPTEATDAATMGYVDASGAVSVKSYGAVGDGITDDTAAIQAALDAESYVFFPSGTYLLSDAGGSVALSANSNQKMIGAGVGITTLYLADNADSHIVNIDGKENITISDMTIDGNRLNQSLGVHCIRAGGNGITGLWLNNLELQNAAQYGVGLQVGSIKDVYMDNLVIRSTGGDGIDIKNKNNDNRNINMNNITVISPGRDVSLTGQAGVDMRGVCTLNNVQVTGLDSDQNGIRFRETGVHGTGGLYSSVTNFFVSGSGATSIGVYIPAERVSVSNGSVVSVNQGINVYGAYNKISNVQADSCGTNGFFTDTGASYATIVGCIARGTGDTGFRLKGDSGIMNACIARASTNEGLEITSDSDGMIITNNQFLSNGAANTKNGTNITAANNVGY